MNDDALVTWAGDWFPRPIAAIVDRIPAAYQPELTAEQGWWPLLVRLDARLATIHPNYRVRRVAVGAGRLVFEIEGSAHRAELEAEISAAVEEAARTCEVCGRPGTPRHVPGSFYSVLCDDDA